MAAPAVATSLMKDRVRPSSEDRLEPADKWSFGVEARSLFVLCTTTVDTMMAAATMAVNAICSGGASPKAPDRESRSDTLSLVEPISVLNMRDGVNECRCLVVDCCRSRPDNAAENAIKVHPAADTSRRHTQPNERAHTRVYSSI